MTVDTYADTGRAMMIGLPEHPESLLSPYESPPRGWTDRLRETESERVGLGGVWREKENEGVRIHKVGSVS